MYIFCVTGPHPTFPVCYITQLSDLIYFEEITVFFVTWLLLCSPSWEFRRQETEFRMIDFITFFRLLIPGF